MSYRPVEDQVIDKEQEQWVDSGPVSKYAKLPCPAIKMVKGQSVALVFDQNQLSFHKRNGWVVDMVHLRKEVMN